MTKDPKSVKEYKKVRNKAARKRYKNRTEEQKEAHRKTDRKQKKRNYAKRIEERKKTLMNQIENDDVPKKAGRPRKFPSPKKQYKKFTGWMDYRCSFLKTENPYLKKMAPGKG